MLQAQLIVQEGGRRAGEMLRVFQRTLRDQRKFGLQVLRQKRKLAEQRQSND